MDGFAIFEVEELSAQFGNLFFLADQVHLHPSQARVVISAVRIMQGKAYNRRTVIAILMPTKVFAISWFYQCAWSTVATRQRPDLKRGKLDRRLTNKIVIQQ